MHIRQILELLTTTGIMALIMSGTMLGYHLGFNDEMLNAWIHVYPVAWMVAIPGIMITRKIVRFLTGLLFSEQATIS